MERIFCIYCKTVIAIAMDNQICPNCAEFLKIPQAELFNGIFILKNEVTALIELEDILKEKILFRGLATNEFTTNEFEVNEDHSISVLKINSNTITTLTSIFNKFNNLIELKVTSRSLQIISEDFKPKNLSDLSLFSCDFSAIPSALFGLTGLTHLWISGTKINLIPAEISNLSLLQILKLNNNKITTVTEKIGVLSNLTILDLGCNFLKTIPEEIFNLQSLIVLKLHINNLTDISRNIIKLVNLQILDLYCNFLTSLPLLPNSLHYLDISSNFHLELPENFQDFNKLELLNVGGIKKVNLAELKKIINESSIITKLNPLSPNISQDFLLK